MIIVSADVHHFSMGGHDQGSLAYGETELKLTEKYLAIANRYGVRPNVYMTGKIAEEEPVLLRYIAENYEMEISGHTYSAYQPWLIWGGLRRLNGRQWPRGFQKG